MKPIYFCFVLLLCAAISACSVKNTLNVRFNKNFNFSSMYSYSTFERNSTFSDIQSINYTMRNSIEIAIEQILDKKGLHYKSQTNADVTVGYYLIDNNAAQLKDYDQTVKYCQPCLSWLNPQTEQWRLLPGSILIDIISNKDQRSVWRSVLPLNIKENDNSKEIQFKINLALETMFDKLP
jgi:hypothetical protein